MPANFPSKKHPAYVELVDENGNQLGTQENPIYTAANIGDGSVTTAMIEDGAVTDEKLAKPKVDVPAGIQPQMVIGTSLSTNVIGMVGYSQDATPDHLAMYSFTGQLSTAAPVANTDAATKKYVDDNLSPKLTATKAAAQANSTATDVAGLVADYNALLAKLRTAGILAT